MADVQLSTLGAVIKTAYEGQSDTNAFTDALLAKLTGIEAGATADMSGAEIEAALDAAIGTGWKSGGGGGGDLLAANNLSDLASAATARTNLGVDAAGTDNSTDVTLAGTPDYITLAGQVLTLTLIDLANDVQGNLPVSNLNGGTGASATTFWRGDGTWATPAGGGGGISNDLDFQAFDARNFTNHVVTGVSGALTAAAHSGNILVTSGNVTIPTTEGFTATLIMGGAHTLTFNATTTAAMAAGDIVTLIVEDATTIHTSRLQAADKVAFS